MFHLTIKVRKEIFSCCGPAVSSAHCDSVSHRKVHFIAYLIISHRFALLVSPWMIKNWGYPVYFHIYFKYKRDGSWMLSRQWLYQ